MEGLNIKGFVDIEVINKKNNTVRHYRKYNTITKAGKSLLLANSAGLFLGNSPNVFDEYAMRQSILGSYDNDQLMYKSWSCLTNVLLNLGETELAGLSANTTFINLFKSDLSGIDIKTDQNVNGKVIGYANINIDPQDSTVEGVLDYTKPDYMPSHQIISRRYRYPQNTGTGVFNCIGMLPATQLYECPGIGLSAPKSLDRINLQESSVSRSSAYVPPGCLITGNNEIILNYTDKNNKSFHKYNFITGEMTDLDSDPGMFYQSGNPSNYPLCDYYVDTTNNMVYILLGGQNYVNYESYSYTGGVLTRVGSTSWIISGNRGGFFTVNNTLYVSGNGDATNCKQLTFDSTTHAITGGTDVTYASLGITIPSGLPAPATRQYPWHLAMYKGNYVLVLANKYKSEYSATPGYWGEYPGFTGIVFSSLSDIMGTIVDIIQNIPITGCLYTAGTNAGLLQTGVGTYASGYNDYYNINRYSRIYNKTSQNGTLYTINDYQGGVYITPDSYWSNFLSFVKLTDPITKTANDEVYISYGYEIT